MQQQHFTGKLPFSNSLDISLCAYFVECLKHEHDFPEYDFLSMKSVTIENGSCNHKKANK